MQINTGPVSPLFAMTSPRDTLGHVTSDRVAQRAQEVIDRHKKPELEEEQEQPQQ